ncbi:hypothetical protein HYFRA_00002212 [Hymenoscyphus fraxineus]|uniref:Zn(2)-C6 fungal-type domain-containing protein n=1 Tax=Hymenoscyphus fraxineus TaxID=746836 RepID=A0A9N9KLB1_9HELO|nr:hypothetical protein HYFRA_00002212 [Hymenoscyphus fraxineus]
MASVPAAHSLRKKMYPEITNRKKQKKPKVTTGCKTCKTRRIKCDEARPECARCVRIGSKCDFAFSQRQILAGPIRPIQPIRRLIQARIPASSSLSIPETLSFTTLFRDEKEHQYFCYFRDEVGKNLAGSFGQSLWQHTIPQACQNDVELRDLMISLAALSRAQNSLQDAASHRVYALTHYNYSIKNINTAINSKPEREATRIALISAILLFCFENLLGEHAAAIKNMETALRLLRHRISHKTPRFSQIQPVSEVPDMDHALLAAFIRMDNTLISRPSLDNIDRTNILEIQFVKSDFHMPSTFGSILEAKAYLEEIQLAAISRFKYTIHLSSDFTENDEDQNIPTSLSLQIQKWQYAFEPLLRSLRCENKSCSSGPSESLATLSALAKVTEMVNQPEWVLSSTLRDSYSVDATEVVFWSKKAVEHPGFKRQFVWHCGIIPALFVVIVGSRNRVVRENAIKVLRSAIPRRELVWDAAEVAKLGERLLAEEDAC